MRVKIISFLILLCVHSIIFAPHTLVSISDSDFSSRASEFHRYRMTMSLIQRFELQYPGHILLTVEVMQLHDRLNGIYGSTRALNEFLTSE